MTSFEIAGVGKRQTPHSLGALTLPRKNSIGMSNGL
jgi:hypothetical protein